MQAEVPGVIDMKGEPEHIRKAYGMIGRRLNSAANV